MFCYIFMSLISALDTFKEVDFSKENGNADEASYSGNEVTNIIEMNENTDGEKTRLLFTKLIHVHLMMRFGIIFCELTYS